MAKKEEFRYLSSSIPEGERKYRIIRWGWNGLNKTDKIDSGSVTDSNGINVDPPYVVPLANRKPWFGEDDVLSIHGFDDKLVVVRNKDAEGQDPKIVADIVEFNANDELYHKTAYTHEFATQNVSDLSPRSVVQFNKVNTSSGNIAEYTYDRLLLFYPEKCSLKYAKFNDETEVIRAFDLGGDVALPEIDMAVVYGSRVFGVNDNAVTASRYNDHTNYDLDTADSTSSANAWYSLSQSNTDADGSFTAIASYDNHAVLFRKDFMQLVYNNKNPFRIVDVGKYGCDNQNAVATMNGVLYFASAEKVYAFTGGMPKVISDKLEAGSLAGAVLGSFKDTLWMQTDDGLYTFKKGAWTKVAPSNELKIRQFATLDYALVGLDEIDNIVFLDWDSDTVPDTEPESGFWDPDYAGGQSPWWFETDFMTYSHILDVKRIKKMSLLCEGTNGATVKVYLLKNGEAYSDQDPVAEYTFTEDGLAILRVLTRMFSGYLHRVRISGTGYVKIHALELKVEIGGDVYVEG